MKRFTITPNRRKSIEMNSSMLKSSQFNRASIASEDCVTKETRNTRDKVYKASCIENVLNFLAENGYDGPFSQKILGNPSNKDFQNILKFIYSFVDSTPFLKFEDDVLSILKLLKYPYSNEITRSQLTVVTPHTWPVVLSMINWLVDLIKRSDESETQTVTVETEFFDYVCEAYMKFMDGEDDESLDQQFIARVTQIHSKEIEDIKNQEKEVDVMKCELENLKSKFNDLSKLESKKKKINEDLNALIMNDKQLESKKTKYISSIEKIMEDIAALETRIEDLIKAKNELIVQINAQTINPQDIKEMNIEKVELFKELERLKPERENLSKALKIVENKLIEKTDENEKLLVEINSMKKGFNVSKETLSYKLIVDLEKEQASKKKSLVDHEINLSDLEDKIREKETEFKDLEEQYQHMNTKLQTIGSIYLEKKGISERTQQKNRNEIDRLENELLKLKLESDSIYLKSEKDYSESKIKLDVLNSFISKEREEIARLVWDFYNNTDSIAKSIELLDKDIGKLSK